MYKDFVRSFKYDAITGVVSNKIQRSSRSLIDHEAGYVRGDGYRVIRFKGKLYLTHRIIWLLVHGYFPEHEIDHINGITGDNRLCNLREVSHTCNLQNTKRRVDNTSGVKGVTFDKGRELWCAQAHLHGKHIHLGRFKSKDEAITARKTWEVSCDGWVCGVRRDNLE